VVMFGGPNKIKSIFSHVIVFSWQRTDIQLVGLGKTRLANWTMLYGLIELLIRTPSACLLIKWFTEKLVTCL
jgi:hypothetical protein